jgi:hypothetical protein
LAGQHNNQPKVAVHGRRDIGEGAQSGRGVWGGHHTIIWGGKLSNIKNKKKIVMALNGCQLIFQMQQPTKYMRALWRRERQGDSTEGGVWGKRDSIILVAKESGGM